MGLDMYAFTTNEVLDTPVDFKVDGYVDVHYWRKHPNLHGWMENLYREKGGKDETFNCVNLQLTADDLDRLEADSRRRGDRSPDRYPPPLRRRRARLCPVPLSGPRSLPARNRGRVMTRPPRNLGPVWAGVACLTAATFNRVSRWPQAATR